MAHPEERDRPEPGPGLLLLVGGVLLALTTLTYFLSHVELGAWAVPVALAIASAKAGLIVAVYMHVREKRGASPLVFATAVVFVLLLAGLAGLENATRLAPTRAPGPYPVETLPAHVPPAQPRPPPPATLPR